MKQILENEKLLIEIDDKGAELTRIFDKEKNREVLWNADPEFWPRHAPVLFPNVGRHYQNTYRTGGASYSSSQHGFARDLPFTCVEKGQDTVTHQLLSDEKTRSSYPFDFVLRVRHAVEGRKLTVFWEVKNPNRETMYFTIGGHPAFALPKDLYRQCRLYFEGKNSLDYLLITPDGSGTADAAHVHTLKLQDGCVALASLKDGDQTLAENFFDLDALIFDHGQIEKVRIILPDGSDYLEMVSPGFSNFGIWAAPGAPFVCLEPWGGRADDTGYTGELKDKPDINALESADTFRKAYYITVF